MLCLTFPLHSSEDPSEKLPELRRPSREVGSCENTERNFVQDHAARIRCLHSHTQLYEVVLCATTIATIGMRAAGSGRLECRVAHKYRLRFLGAWG